MKLQKWLILSAFAASTALGLGASVYAADEPAEAASKIEKANKLSERKAEVAALKAADRRGRPTGSASGR